MHARQSAHGMSPDGAVAAPPLPLVPGKTTEGSEESNEE